MKNNKFNIDRKTLSTNCGVYWFKDSNDIILYIGKAKNIKKRIEQYFNGTQNSYKTPILLEKATKLEYQICKNEKEALILEQELIKKNKPYYNILFLDDKKYPYIVIELKNNKLEFKTRFIYKNIPNTFYFGPLPPNYGYKIIKNFLIHECLYENGLPIQNNSRLFWKEKFDYAKKILSSSNREIINKLKNQMLYYSNNEQYELAKECYEVIHFLSNNQNQSITFEENQNFDVLYFHQEEKYLMIMIHYFKNGSFFMQEETILEIKLNLEQTIIEFINQFYLVRNIPDFIVTNFHLNAEELIINKKIIIPQKGKYYQALENAKYNIDINKKIKLTSYISKSKIIDKVKKFLFDILNLTINDFVMIDNSSENNQDIVSVIIYYKNFLPHYQNYRKYKINDVKRKSDVEFIKQGLTKYFSSNEEIPNLIIVDGAIQQLSEAQKVLESLKIKLPIIGLVKDQYHKTNYIVDKNKNKILINDKDVYNFFSKIQIEVDAYAKSFHSKRKLDSSLEGFLTTIKGIGNKTEERLLNHFKNYNNIYNASKEELLKVVSENIATKIMKKLGK